MNMRMWKGIFGSEEATITFPTTLTKVQTEMRGLEEFGKSYGPVSGVCGEGPAQVLNRCVKVDDLNTEAGIQNLNRLAEVIDCMGSERLNLLSGALALEQAKDLNDVLHIIGSPDQYEIFPKIEDFSQASITAVKFSSPHLAGLLPLDAVSVEDANTLALCLHEMEEDGVRRTEFGLVRRLSKPFPPEPEIGQAMM